MIVKTHAHTFSKRYALNPNREKETRNDLSPMDLSSNIQRNIWVDHMTQTQARIFAELLYSKTWDPFFFSFIFEIKI